MHIYQHLLREPYCDKTTAYPCDGTVFVSRADAVREVLDRQGDFEVVHESKMRKIAGGTNFLLGMQDGADYQRDTSIMRLDAQRDDVADTVLPQAREAARQIIADQTKTIVCHRC